MNILAKKIGSDRTYKDRVEFVEVIKDDLSNIHLLEEKIEELLKGEKEVPVWENFNNILNYVIRKISN